MFVQITSAYVHITNDNLNTSRLSQFVQILFYRILRKTITYCQYSCRALINRHRNKSRKTFCFPRTFYLYRSLSRRNTRYGNTFIIVHNNSSHIWIGRSTNILQFTFFIWAKCNIYISFLTCHHSHLLRGYYHPFIAQIRIRLFIIWAWSKNISKRQKNI